MRLAGFFVYESKVSIKAWSALHAEDIAGNPPGEEEDDIGPEGDGVESDALEAVETVPEVVP